MYLQQMHFIHVSFLANTYQIYTFNFWEFLCIIIANRKMPCVCSFSVINISVIFYLDTDIGK